jgi:hypothetical protein
MNTPPAKLQETITLQLLFSGNPETMPIHTPPT